MRQFKTKTGNIAYEVCCTSAYCSDGVTFATTATIRWRIRHITLPVANRVFCKECFDGEINTLPLL